MKLALAIPVWNDTPGLAALLAQARRMGCFDQVVVVDDGSDTPVDLNDREVFDDLPGADIILLRNDTPHGAGQARNRALEAVTASHLVFFDSDDQFTTQFAPLWRSLERRVFDFCLYKHNDNRVLARGGWGQGAQDNALWRLAGCAVGALQVVDETAAAWLAETSNYPWNKIYRTAFLREYGLRFSEIPVHNDLALHWMCFAHGRNILASDRVAATHFVHPAGARLTNRRGSERLRVFEPLNEVVAHIRAGKGRNSALMLALLRFASGLTSWIRGNIDPALHGDLDRLAARFFARHLDSGSFQILIRSDPVLALRLNLLMAMGSRT